MVEPTAVVTLLAFALLGVAWMIRLLPVGTCPECGHCKVERLRQEAAREPRNARFYGIPQCASCGRYHPPGEDHPA